MRTAIAPPDLETRQGPKTKRKTPKVRKSGPKSWRSRNAIAQQWRKEVPRQGGNPRTVWETAIVRVETRDDDGNRVQYILPDTQGSMDTHTLSMYIQRRLESLTPGIGDWTAYDENLSEKLDEEGYYFVSRREEIPVAWVFYAN